MELLFATRMPTRWAQLAIAGWLSFSPVAEATNTPAFELRLRGGGSLSAGQVEVTMQALDPACPDVGSGDGELRWNLAMGRSHRLPLDIDCAWEVSLKGENLWAPVVQSRIGEAGLVLDVWPLAKVLVHLEGGAEDSHLAEAQVALTGRHSVSRFDQAWTFGCRIASSVVECLLPRTTIDLRLQVKGFIPSYWFDLDLEGSPVRDVGAMRLQQGASLVGWVQHDDRGPSDGGSTTVRLEISSRRETDLRNAARMARHSVVTKPDEEGFFQLRGLAARPLRVDSGTGWVRCHPSK